MKQPESISASQISNTDPKTIEKTKSLSQVKNLMEEERKLAVPVVDEKNNFEGAIGYRELIRFLQVNPEHTKLSKVTHQPPEYETEDNLVELADLRINSGRKMMVNTEGDKLKSVIGEQELLEGFKQTKVSENVTTLDVGTSEVITVFEDDSFEEARHKILDNNISRLPVLDNNGKLVGKLHSLDLLKLLVPREKINSGGTSSSAQGQKDVQIAGGIEKEKISNIEVQEFMDRTPTVNEGHISAKEAADKMLESNSTDVIITNDQYPISVTTVKDFLDHLNRFKKRESVLINLIGLELPEEKAAIHDKIKNQIQGSIGRKLDKPTEITFHFKKKEKDGKKHRYELNAKLRSDAQYGIITADTESWDLLEGTDDLLAKLNKQILKKKEELEEKRPRNPEKMD